jgi:error-prone DNA polymerase
LPKRALILLADADAFRSIGLDRREALWAVRRLPDDVPLPLFEIATAREQPDENARAVAADAAAGTGGRRLSDHPAVAERPSDGIFARDVCARARRRLQGRQSHDNERRASAAPAWCWCGSGRAAPRASCS